MSYTLQAAIAQAQQYLKSLDGLRAAPEYPPDKLGAFPLAVAYAGPGAWLPGTPAGCHQGLHTIIIEIHTSRGDLAKAVEQLMPYVDSVPALLLDRLWNDRYWNGTLQTFQQITTTGLVASRWNGVETVALRFRVEGVKQTNTVP